MNEINLQAACVEISVDVGQKEYFAAETASLHAVQRFLDCAVGIDEHK